MSVDAQSMPMDDQETKENEENSLPEAGTEDLKDRLLAEASAAEEEESEQLHELVELAVGLKAPKKEAPPPDPESIAHITKGQIKSMRQVSAERSSQKEPLADRLGQAIIQIYCGVAGLFSFSSGKVKETCEMKGHHQCTSCGQLFSVSDSKPIVKK
jgi:hypothetical protein